MGSNISGFRNESDLKCYLFQKRVCDLNDNLKKFILFLFPDAKDSDFITTSQGKPCQKPDVVIEIQQKKKNISVKMGQGNSVHQEDIGLFMSFLTTLDVSEETRLELLKFHFADGTVDGTGTERISGKEYKQKHKE